MQITLLDNAQEIRARFSQKFVMDWPEYQTARKEFIKRWGIEKKHFDGMLMWDRMRPEYPTVSFRDALALLQTLPGEVLFLSEGPDYPDACALELEGEQFLHFIAAADARALAEQIEYEWMEDARLFAENRYLANKILPDDLYVVTPNMDRLLVFTHETTDRDAEMADEFIRQAESRLCIAYGFDTQKGKEPTT